MSRDTTPLEGQLKNFISDGTPPEIIARYESLPERAQRSDFGRFDNNVVVWIRRQRDSLSSMMS